MDEGRPVPVGKSPQLVEGLGGRDGTVRVPLGPLGTKGAAVPPAAAGGAVGEDEARGEVAGKGEEVVGRQWRLPAFRTGAEEGQEGLFPRPGDHVVHETAEGVAPGGAPQPRGHEPAAEHHREIRKPLPDKADEGKGGDRLAQVVERDTYDPDVVQQLREAPAEPGEEGIALRLRRCPEETGAGDRRKVGLLIVREPHRGPILFPCHGQEAVQVHNRPYVTVGGTVGLPLPQRGQVASPPLHSPTGPGVGPWLGLLHEPEEPLQVGIEHAAREAIDAKRPGKAGNAGGGLAGFGNRGMDEEHGSIMGETEERGKAAREDRPG